MNSKTDDGIKYLFLGIEVIFVAILVASLTAPIAVLLLAAFGAILTACGIAVVNRKSPIDFIEYPDGSREAVYKDGTRVAVSQD